MAALGLDGSSLLVHWLAGHQPGSQQALPLLEFISEHPAFWVVAAALVALWLLRRP